MILELEKKFEASPNFIVANFSKLETSELDKLRLSLKLVKSDYMVVKNSMTKQVLKKLKIKEAENLFSESCGVIFSGSDAIATSKCTVNFAKDHEAFKIKGGYVDGAVIDLSLVKQLAALPSREALLSKLLGVMKSPISGLVNVLSGTTRSLLYVLEAIRKKKSE